MTKQQLTEAFMTVSPEAAKSIVDSVTNYAVTRGINLSKHTVSLKSLVNACIELTKQTTSDV